ncbi:hypothetical protein [Liquorilactobacillus ghanensis]|nr:hypothetical protein [Liquorilactobacillus ghanensis]
MVRFNFLNSTSRDIAFFHSCFYVNNELKELYTNRTVAWNSSNPHFIWNKGDSSSDLIFPDNVNGIFKANSLTPFYAYIPLPENESVPKKITFSIKIAVRRFPYITIKQQYTEICYEYDLTNFSIELLMVKNKYTHNNIERYKTKQMLRKQEELKAKRRPKKRKS